MSVSAAATQSSLLFSLARPSRPPALTLKCPPPEERKKLQEAEIEYWKQKENQKEDIKGRSRELVLDYIQRETELEQYSWCYVRKKAAEKLVEEFGITQDEAKTAISGAHGAHYDEYCRSGPPGSRGYIAVAVQCKDAPDYHGPDAPADTYKTYKGIRVSVAEQEARDAEERESILRVAEQEARAAADRARAGPVRPRLYAALDEAGRAREQEHVREEVQQLKVAIEDFNKSLLAWTPQKAQEAREKAWQDGFDSFRRLHPRATEKAAIAAADRSLREYIKTSEQREESMVRHGLSKLAWNDLFTPSGKLITEHADGTLSLNAVKILDHASGALILDLSANLGQNVNKAA